MIECPDMKTPYPAIHKKVAVVIDMAAGASARDVLSGIFKFVNTGHPWTLRIIRVPEDSLLTASHGLLDEGLDGLIVTCASDANTNAVIAACHLPTVFVDVRHPLFEQRTDAAAFIRNDNEGIGTIGARYLCGLGNFNSYGFVPSIERHTWSNLREQAFCAELAVRKSRARVFNKGSQHSAEDECRLRDWLEMLPKPCALMCAHDFRATQVLEVCSQMKLEVPEQVAIIGVDNDELLCNSHSPPLSSIRPNHLGEGFLAGRELSRLFHLGTRAKRRETTCRALGIVERESTKATTPATALLRRALAFIDANLCTNLKTDDVAESLSVSRRLLERRFRNLRNESIHDYIVMRRLSLVKRLLKTTRRSCAKIASECGFSSANFLSHLFIRKVGCSMRDYRNSTPVT